MEFDPNRDEEEVTLDAMDEAQRFVELLVQAGAIELERALNPSELAELSAIIGGPDPAERLFAWLMEQDVVAEIFVDEEQLAVVLAKW